jgi:hypothetical protein
MDDKISADELKESLGVDIEQLCHGVVEAVNKARAGHIIADSEEPVRDASAEFRERLYQKALELRQRRIESSFSPSGQCENTLVAQQGQAEHKLPDNQRQG